MPIQFLFDHVWYNASRLGRAANAHPNAIAFGHSARSVKIVLTIRDRGI